MYCNNERVNIDQVLYPILNRINVRKPRYMLRIGLQQDGKNRPVKLVFGSKEENNSFLETT